LLKICTFFRIWWHGDWKIQWTEHRPAIILPSKSGCLWSHSSIIRCVESIHFSWVLNVFVSKNQTADWANCVFESSVNSRVGRIVNIEQLSNFLWKIIYNRQKTAWRSNETCVQSWYFTKIFISVLYNKLRIYL